MIARILALLGRRAEPLVPLAADVIAPAPVAPVNESARRARQVMLHPAFAGRETLATHLLVGSDMPAERIIAALEASASDQFTGSEALFFQSNGVAR